MARLPLFVAATTAAATVMLMAGGCTQPSQSISWQDNGMPRHENGADSWWNYQFVYHPDDQVYYEPYTKTFHWFDDGTWRSGDNTPDEMWLDPAMARVVYLKLDEFPWGQHDTVAGTWEPRRDGRPVEYDALAWAYKNGFLRAPGTPEAFANVSSEYDRP